MSTLLKILESRHRVKGVRIKATTAKVQNDDTGMFAARITQEIVDRQREVLLVSGIQTADFARMGAVFLNHDYSAPLAIPGPTSTFSDHIIARATWLDTPLAREWRAFVAEMQKAGKEVGVSIGFIPLEERRPTKADRERFGDGLHGVISKSLMLEWSIAPVPVNAESVLINQPAVKRRGHEQADKARRVISVTPRKPSIIVAKRST